MLDGALFCRRYYRLAESFPTQQMLTRSETGKKRNFYFSSSLVRELTIRNEHSVKVRQAAVLSPSFCSHLCYLFVGRSSTLAPRPLPDVRIRMRSASFDWYRRYVCRLITVLLLYGIVQCTNHKCYNWRPSVAYPPDSSQ